MANMVWWKWDIVDAGCNNVVCLYIREELLPHWGEFKISLSTFFELLSSSLSLNIPRIVDAPTPKFGPLYL